jgi:hypothetical protein
LAEQEPEEDEDGNEKQNKERPKFDTEGFLKKWDEDNPEIHVPPEVIDDIDNDYNLEDVNETAKE